ncbi:hypothetical protein [Spirosoma areae]
MSATIRYIFPGVDPWSLETEDFVRLWREAQYIVKTFRLITKEE